MTETPQGAGSLSEEMRFQFLVESEQFCREIAATAAAAGDNDGACPVSKQNQKAHACSAWLSLDANQRRKRLTKIGITSLIYINRNMLADDKLLRQCDCYGVVLFCSCTTYVIKCIMNKLNILFPILKCTPFHSYGPP